ncbi:hypothetical protein N7468_006164 [Penicillium chermesinum]|uniref:Uncharacterized protein n=1 Tax=Penicillium chermesinum TaxID=63820 RepID=A0A9W9NRU9_9EURO|nr:uncharacterized protein N7468_006164 [Penicillium chermesinum]KAJ5224939.1 hypothetical protein N7468_006164 [Penicillium chermesinum]
MSEVLHTDGRSIKAASTVATYLTYVSAVDDAAVYPSSSASRHNLPSNMRPFLGGLHWGLGESSGADGDQLCLRMLCRLVRDYKAIQRVYTSCKMCQDTHISCNAY